ncbi:MAG: iron-containing redox enzyme family protein [Candidatus Omnitrophica bacterium]|nr:iron-containing redox enzyme family protein [Candidatus Omnitrophota bacterium]
MSIRALVESEYARQTEALTSNEAFQMLETGKADTKAYNVFIANVCKTHLRSPQILAFLYSVAPPASTEDVKHNMLEELGLDEEGIPHPKLLIKLAQHAGFNECEVKTLEVLAQDELKRMTSEQILYGSMKEIGLSALLETASFEWMLSRLASQMAKFLEKHRGISKDGLDWFLHHSEVDIRHAEEQLDSIEEYVKYYQFDQSHFESILELTFRENVFIKRYFGEIALARHSGMLD